ncbi:MAG: methylated-DNA--[protein]-cysteine S-methyltransferase [Candidatus Micrarchaeia archaeon]
MKQSDIKKVLTQSNLTAFQQKVLMALLTVPKGKTITYKELAKKVNSPNSYRAVGTSLKKNPLPIIIPCHRVVKSDGSIGEYSYGGTKRKAELLKYESESIKRQKFNQK